MEYQKMKWFKFYATDYLTDPKMIALTPTEKAIWLTLLCLASVSEPMGVIRYITEEKLLALTGVNPTSVEGKGVLARFEKLDMVKHDPATNSITVTNFQKRQNSYLTAYERVKKHRQKGKKDDDNTNDNVNDNAKITLDKDIDKDIDINNTSIVNITSDVLPKNIEPDDIGLARLLLEKIVENNPNFKAPNLDKWAEEVSKIRRLDNRTPEQIRYLIIWSQKDDFWSSNILSPAKLRKQFDRLVMQVKREQGKKGEAKGIII